MPLVDANMRELAATGWMSNRGRQNVASYLILDLGIDWRRGAEHFETLLLDYDTASNWGNWVAAAGLTGGRLNKFNITKQSRDYDANGDYLRAWIPELADVPTEYVFCYRSPTCFFPPFLSAIAVKVYRYINFSSRAWSIHQILNYSVYMQVHPLSVQHACGSAAASRMRHRP